MDLYELVSADNKIAFSPAVWRTRMQLLMKGISFKSVPWHFIDKDAIAPSGSKAVPVIKDGDIWVADSFDIALYLDEKYPDPALFSGPDAIEAARFFNHWAAANLLTGLFPMIAIDVWKLHDKENADYFRSSREKFLGTTLEAAADAARPNLPAIHKALTPAERVLSGQSFLGGTHMGYSDTVLFGVFMWARAVSTFDTLPKEGAVTDWFNRMLDAFDGHARKAPTVA